MPAWLGKPGTDGKFSRVIPPVARLPRVAVVDVAQPVTQRGNGRQLMSTMRNPWRTARVATPFHTSITAIRKSTGGAYVPTVVVGMYAPFGGWPEGTHATTCPWWAFLVPPRHVADLGIGAYIPPKNGGTYAPPAMRRIGPGPTPPLTAGGPKPRRGWKCRLGANTGARPVGRTSWGREKRNPSSGRFASVHTPEATRLLGAAKGRSLKS